MITDGHADVGGAWQLTERQIANLRPSEPVGAVHLDKIAADAHQSHPDIRITHTFEGTLKMNVGAVKLLETSGKHVAAPAGAARRHHETIRPELGEVFSHHETRLAPIADTREVRNPRADIEVAGDLLINEAKVVEHIPDVASRRGDIEAAVGDNGLTGGCRAADVNAGERGLRDGAQRKGNSQPTRKTEKYWFHFTSYMRRRSVKPDRER